MLPFLVGACAFESEPPPRDYPPLAFDYLTKLRLNVASVDIDDDWHGGADPRQVGGFAPETPLTALRRMAQDRLVPVGATGRAVVTIEDASILRRASGLDASFAVRLSVDSGDGRTGYAEARVVRSLPLAEQTPGTLRAGLYTLVKQTMDDMNVEFEFQIRRSLSGFLEQVQTAPPPPSVEQQPL